MRARFNSKNSATSGEIEGFDALVEAFTALLDHEKLPVCSNWQQLIDLMWARFSKGDRDFYCWDEMTKVSEMNWLMNSDLQPGPVLELCCGFSYWVREAIETIDIGVDLFPEAGSYSRSMDALADDHHFAGNTYRSLLRADVTRPLPVPEGSLANIISFCAFEHIPSVAYPRLFHSIKKMLKPGGRLVFSVQSRLCYETLYRYLKPELVDEIRAKAVVAELFDAKWWDQWLAQNGFKILRRKGAIDRERSLMYTLAFAPGGFRTNPLTVHYSKWLRQTDSRDWFDEAVSWLCEDVDPEDADLLFYEVTL